MKNRIADLPEAPRMYQTENDISLQRRTELNTLMNQRLADAVDLQMQMKQAYWNVNGPSFIGLHELFDKVDEAVESYVDLTAERIVQLGGVAAPTGHKVRVAPSEDEDEEGRSDNERLVEGGIAEAEIEQSFQATRAAANRDL